MEAHVASDRVIRFALIRNTVSGDLIYLFIILKCYVDFVAEKCWTLFYGLF